VGREFAGYRIERVIGRGALGEVYVGIHPRLDMEHALKVLFRDVTEDPDFRERFQRQARRNARLSHPNIVPIFDFGEESGRLYLVMPHIRGMDLRRMLRRERTLGPA